MDNLTYKQALFDKEKFAEQLAYWSKEISGELKPMELPMDFMATGMRKTGKAERAVERIPIILPGVLAEKAIHISRSSDLTLYVVLLAAFKAFLTRCAKNDEIIIASPPLQVDPETGEHDKFNKRIFFRDVVNTGLTFKELLLETKNKTLQAFKNQNYPLDLVFKKCRLNTGDYPFLDRVVFLLTNLHNKEDAAELDYDLLFLFSREAKTIDGEILFNRRIFQKETVEQFANRYIKVLAACLQNTDLKIKELEILSVEETRQLLYEFNLPPSDYPGDMTIRRLFAGRAEQVPDKVAVVDAGQKAQKAERYITYRQLIKEARALACLLRKKGVGPDIIVGIMMEPTIEMIAGILGIMEAGGAYLPIDPLTPENRIYSMLNDSGAAILLTAEEPLQRFSFTSLQNPKNQDIKPLITPGRPLVDNIDSLQIPDRSYIDYEKYQPYIGQSMIKNSITFQFSRGCLYKCAYCFKIWPNNRYVNRSAENMFAELMAYYKIGVRKFSFVDDLPNFNIKECLKFYKMVVQNRLEVQFAFPNGLRGDILTRELIDLMVEAGTISLDIALETTSRRLQKLIGKNLNLDRLHENIVYMIEKHPQLILETQLLHGIPTETEEEARASLEYLKSLKWIHYPYLHVLKIYPGTDMAKLAMEHGVSRQAIEASDELGYNELPETLPFSKSFTHKYQSEFAGEYFMARERLLAVLPYQMKVLTEDELVQKYNSFLPVTIKRFSDLLDYVGIQRHELDADFLPGDYGRVPNLNTKIREHFPRKNPLPYALKVLLIDVSAYFSSDRHGVVYDVVEPSLGLMYLQTHLDRLFGNKVNGKIIASRVNYDSFAELRAIIEDFKPAVIGIRTLNFYKKFFHKTVSLIRQWGIDVPIITGGPYATSSLKTVLSDPHIDLVVLGEGEITFAEIIEKMMANNGILPGEDILRTIPGIAFIEKRKKISPRRHTREILLLDHWLESNTAEAPTNPPAPDNPANLAYIIYTSGSTGIPRGVMIQQSNLVNQVQGLVKKFNFDSSHHYILLAPVTFDVSVMHIFLPIITGAQLYLLPDRIKKDSFKLWQFIKDNQVDILNIVPVFMKALLENMEKKKISFKYIFVGGDVFDRELYDSLNETFQVENIINIYGPTETTINATAYRCNSREIAQYKIIPIGKPLINYCVFILDNDLNFVPVGVKGELCISGSGVARGYLNNPELTKDKFILPSATKNPFEKGPHGGRGLLDFPKLLFNHHLPLTTHPFTKPVTWPGGCLPAPRRGGPPGGLSNSWVEAISK